MKRLYLAAALLLALLPSASLISAAACTPTAATFCLGADDLAEVWVNGVSLGFVFNYVDQSSASPVPCVSVPLALLNAGGPNYLAVRLQNTAPSVTMACWYMDVTCSDGSHSYLSSNDAFEFFEDLDNSSPPPVLGGFNWYEPAYVPAPAWGAPTTVTGAFWLKQPIHPYTGIPLPPKSWTSNADGASTGGFLYFRQGFVVVPQPTFTVTPIPPPPVFAMCYTSSGGQCEFTGDNVTVPFTLQIYNTGYSSDKLLSISIVRPAPISFTGPWSDPSWTINSSGQTDTFSRMTFPGYTTITIPITNVIYYTPPAQIGTFVTITAQISYDGSLVQTINIVMGIQVGGACTSLPSCAAPSPTASPTQSNTFTASASPTSTPTSLGTATATPSFSASPTPPPSNTASPTAPPSPTFTGSPTPSQTATALPTNTPLPTNTKTPPPLILKGLPSSPNPADDKGVWIAYELSVDATVDIGLYTVAGEKVRSLDPFPGKAGANEQFWDLVNNTGGKVASGVFIYSIIATAATGEQQKVMAKLSVAR